LASKQAQKGTRAEYKVRDRLREFSGLQWERCPSSGALGAQFKMKGDIYVPGEKNLYTIEVKSYKEDHLSSKILTNTTSPLFEWWEQAIREAGQNDNIPLLVYKWDRSKFYIMTYEMYDNPKHIYISQLDAFVYDFEQFLKSNNITNWIK
jgi:Holliday junction resolvase